MLLLGLLFFSCTKKNEEQPRGTAATVSADNRVVATVNGDPITLAEFQERFGRTGIKPEHDAELEIKEEFLNRLIERKMMLGEAQRKRIKVGLPEIDKKIEGSARSTEKTLRKYFRARALILKSGNPTSGKI